MTFIALYHNIQAVLEHAKLDQPVGQSSSTLFIDVSLYKLSANNIGLDAPELAKTLDALYDQVKLVGLDWVRIGFWSRNPTIGQTADGQMVKVKEVVSTYTYLRPRGEDVTVFTLSHDEWGDIYVSGALEGISDRRMDFDGIDERVSGIPLYAIVWDETNPVYKTPSRNVIQLGNKPWSSLDEETRQRIESGILSFTIQCDYKTPEELVLKGIIWRKHTIGLYLSSDSLPLEQYAFRDGVALSLVSAAGRILDNLLTEPGAAIFFQERSF